MDGSELELDSHWEWYLELVVDRQPSRVDRWRTLLKVCATLVEAAVGCRIDRGSTAAEAAVEDAESWGPYAAPGPY